MSKSLDESENVSRILDFFSAKPSVPLSWDEIGVQTFYGSVNGKQVVVIASNPDPRINAIGKRECEVIQDALALARNGNQPLLFLWSTSGARISEGPIGLSEIAKVLREALRPRTFPIISVVLGPTAGIGAYLTGLAEFSLMLKGTQLFMTGPKVVAELIGIEESKEQIGGYLVHEQSELPTEICEDLSNLEATIATLFEILLAKDSKREFPFKAYSGSAIDLRLKRIAGQLCGTVHLAQHLGDPAVPEIRKLNMFLRTCSALDLPIVTQIDTRGMKPGSHQEREGALLQGAELMRQMASYPAFRLAVISGGSIAAIHLALGALSFSADYVLATRDADISVMTESARKAFGDSTVFTPEGLLASGIINEVVATPELALRIESIISERARFIASQS